MRALKVGTHLAAVVALALLLVPSAQAEYSATVAGTSYEEGDLLEVTLGATCVYHCTYETLRVVVSTRAAKLVRRPGRRWDPKRKRKVWKPGVARMTSECRPHLPEPGRWHRTSPTQWLWNIRSTGWGFLGREPAVEILGTLPAGIPSGTYVLQYEPEYGTRMPCIYVVEETGFLRPQEDCLPEFQESIRRELCKQEGIPATLQRASSEIVRGH